MRKQLAPPRPEPRPARLAFRPTVEKLESRDVPSIVSVTAGALQELPAAVTLVGVNIQAGNATNGETTFKIVNNDIAILNANAPLFAPASRQQIDMALFTSGFQLFQEGFQLQDIGAQNANPLASQDGQTVEKLGITAIVSGYSDFLAASNGISAGNLVLP
jgi:hypothetical protein